MFDPKKPPTPEEQLRAVPLRNEKARLVEAANGSSAEVTVPLVYSAAMETLATLLRLRREKTYLLDGVGWAVYGRIDGKRTVQDLVAWFMDSYRLSFNEARVLMMRYLQMLMERGLVVVVGLGQGHPA
jgi:hypothetical protein